MISGGADRDLQRYEVFTDDEIVREAIWEDGEQDDHICVEVGRS